MSKWIVCYGILIWSQLITYIDGVILCSNRAQSWRDGILSCLGEGGNVVKGRDLDTNAIISLNIPYGSKVWLADYGEIADIPSGTDTSNSEFVRCGYVTYDQRTGVGRDVSYGSCNASYFFVCESPYYGPQFEQYLAFTGSWRDALECDVNIDGSVLPSIHAPYGRYWIRKAMESRIFEPTGLGIPVPDMCGTWSKGYWLGEMNYTSMCSQDLRIMCHLRSLSPAVSNFSPCDKAFAFTTAHHSSSTVKMTSSMITSPSSTLTTPTPALPPSILTIQTTTRPTTSGIVNTPSSPQNVSYTPSNFTNTQEIAQDENTRKTGLIVGVTVGTCALLVVAAVLILIVFRRQYGFRRDPSTNKDRRGHINSGYNVDEAVLQDGNEYEEVVINIHSPTVLDVSGANYAKVKKSKGNKAETTDKENVCPPMTASYSNGAVPNVRINTDFYLNDKRVETVYANASDKSDTDTVYETYDHDNNPVQSGSNALDAANSTGKDIAVDESDVDDDNIDCFTSDSDSFDTSFDGDVNLKHFHGTKLSADDTYYSYVERTDAELESRDHGIASVYGNSEAFTLHSENRFPNHGQTLPYNESVSTRTRQCSLPDSNTASDCDGDRADNEESENYYHRLEAMGDPDSFV